MKNTAALCKAPRMKEVPVLQLWPSDWDKWPDSHVRLTLERALVQVQSSGLWGRENKFKLEWTHSVRLLEEPGQHRQSPAKKAAGRGMRAVAGRGAQQGGTPAGPLRAAHPAGV